MYPTSTLSRADILVSRRPKFTPLNFEVNSHLNLGGGGEMVCGLEISPPLRFPLFFIFFAFFQLRLESRRPGFLLFFIFYFYSRAIHLFIFLGCIALLLKTGLLAVCLVYLSAKLGLRRAQNAVCAPSER